MKTVIAGAVLLSLAFGWATAGCAGLTGVDGLSVVADGADTGASVEEDARTPSDSGAAMTTDSSTGPIADAGVLDSSVAQDSNAAPVDSSLPPADAQPATKGCVPLGVQPCAESNQNCIEDTADLDANPLDPPAVCIPITGGFGEGQPCNSSNDCATGLDCVGDPEAGGYACQWMCYESIGAIESPPPFNTGVLGTTPGRGGCPPFEVCGAVNGYPLWLGACSGSN